MQMVTTYKDIVTSNKILTEASNRLANPTVVVKKAQKQCTELMKTAEED